MRDLVVIVSCCNVDNSRPLCYINTRSVYTNEERYRQTLQTIDSVRKMIPGCDIWLAEVSKLSDEQRLGFIQLTDRILDFTVYPQVYKQSISPFKGPTELLVMKIVLKFPEIQKYDRIFKFSARYILYEKFSINKYVDDKVNMRKFENNNNYVSTVLYCVGKKCIYEFLNDIENSLLYTMNGQSIEAIVGKTLKNVNWIDDLGLMGYVSVDGNLVYH